MPALLALVSAAVFGAADFTGGHATRRSPVLTVTLISNLTGAVMAAVLVLVLDTNWSPAALAWGAAGGGFGLVGIVLLYQGLAGGANRVVSPLSAVLAALIPVAVGILGGDRPDQSGVIGLVLAGPAIWLVAGGDVGIGAASRRTLTLAVGAGVGFGLFFVCLAQTPDDAGPVPLLAARAASTALLLMVAFRQPPAGSGSVALGWSALAGALDMSANGLFLWSTVDGDLAVVGALVNLYPVTTILLAIAVLRERLTRAQALGLTLAIVTAVLLS